LVRGNSKESKPRKIFQSKYPELALRLVTFPFELDMRSDLLAGHETEDREKTNSRAPAHATDGETNSKIG
jgi:hypothetical protein